MINNFIDTNYARQNRECIFKKFPDFYLAYKDHNKILDDLLFNNDKVKDTMPLSNSEWIGLFNCNNLIIDTDVELLNLHDAIKYVFDACVFVQFKQCDNLSNDNIINSIKRVIVSDRSLYDFVKSNKYEKYLDVSDIEFYNKNSIGDSIFSCNVGDMVKFKDSNGIKSYDIGMVTSVDDSTIEIIFKNGYKTKVNKMDSIQVNRLMKL